MSPDTSLGGGPELFPRFNLSTLVAIGFVIGCLLLAITAEITGFNEMAALIIAYSIVIILTAILFVTIPIWILKILT